MKGAFNRGQRPDFTFYRDHNDREVDILSIDGKTLTAVEVKTTSRPDGRTARRLFNVDALNSGQGRGAVACMVDKTYPLSDSVVAFPVGMV